MFTHIFITFVFIATSYGKLKLDKPSILNIPTGKCNPCDVCSKFIITIIQINSFIQKSYKAQIKTRLTMK